MLFEEETEGFISGPFSEEMIYLGDISIVRVTSNGNGLQVYGHFGLYEFSLCNREWISNFQKKWMSFRVKKQGLKEAVNQVKVGLDCLEEEGII